MRFQDKVVIIVGATGGLGQAYARTFQREGAKLLLAARNEARLAKAAAELGDEAVTVVADITQADTLTALQETAISQFRRVDVVVNATGMDVRKSFTAHTDSDIERSVAINLLGAVRLTHAFWPLFREQGQGVIVHTGGFADGRLAFPYYSVDVATRAGIMSFAESLNRETNDPSIVVMFFSPSAADTEAERPYHPIWEEMGSRIEPVEQVAAELIDAVARKKQVYIMGGFIVRFFAKLNAVAPKLADLLAMNGYRKILRRFLT